MADVSGKATLVTRYFCKLKPPPDFAGTTTGEDNNKGGSTQSPPADEKIAWFVSLIPYLPKNALFPGLPVIWQTCEQFIGSVCGSEIDHSILLANYFCSIGKRAYLLVGNKNEILI